MSNATNETQSRAERIAELLIEASYCRQWSQKIPNTQSVVECWTGERGALIVQVWERNRGVAVYTECGVPAKWDDFAAWLRGEQA
jgi:molybdate-binding protein